MCDVLDIPGCRAKRTKIWTSGVSLVVYMVLLTVVKYSISVWCISDVRATLIMSRKPVVVEQNGPKFQTQR